jgi:hypothetical protein
MATILERRKKIEKEQRRFGRKLLALQAECLHPDGMIVMEGNGHTEVCPDCLWGNQDDLDPFADSEMAGGVQ